MTDITLESLHNDIAALRREFGGLRQEVGDLRQEFRIAPLPACPPPVLGIPGLPTSSTKPQTEPWP